MTGPHLLLAALGVPLLGGAGVLAAGRRPNVREAMTLATGAALLAVLLGLWRLLDAGAPAQVVLAEMLPGLPLVLRVEPLGMLFALVAGVLWPVTSIYSIGYMRGHHEQHQTRFYFWFTVAIASVMGIAFAGNLLTLFAFYETLTLSTFPLVTHAGTDEARRAGRVYLGLLLGTSVVLLMLAIVWTWRLAGTLDFRPGGILAGTAPAWAVGLLYALFLFGIGKAALMPVHRWLPAAMVAPTPVSALLHAVAVVKAGVFTVLKVTVYVFGVDLLAGARATVWMPWVAAFTIVAASLVAMSKDNLKARLAYSTISQLGYVVLGATLATPLGIAGGGLQIAAHAFGKITLFFCAGAILVAHHRTKVSELDGLGRAMPFTMAAFFVGALSIIGLPPTGGTWSKWLLVEGALQADRAALVGVLLLSSLLNVAYLLPIPLRAFFRPPSGDHPPAGTGVREAPVACLVAIGLSVAGTLALFFYPEPVYRLVSHLAVR